MVGRVQIQITLFIYLKLNNSNSNLKHASLSTKSLTIEKPMHISYWHRNAYFNNIEPDDSNACLIVSSGFIFIN